MLLSSPNVFVFSQVVLRILILKYLKKQCYLFTDMNMKHVTLVMNTGWMYLKRDPKDKHFYPRGIRIGSG